MENIGTTHGSSPAKAWQRLSIAHPMLWEVAAYLFAPWSLAREISAWCFPLTHSEALQRKSGDLPGGSQSHKELQDHTVHLLQDNFIGCHVETHRSRSTFLKLFFTSGYLTLSPSNSLHGTVACCQNIWQHQLWLWTVLDHPLQVNPSVAMPNVPLEIKMDLRE